MRKKLNRIPAQVLALVLGFSAGASRAALDTSDGSSIAKGMVLLTENQKRDAFGVLERLFQVTDNLSKKQETAALLAFADNKVLKFKKPQYYAEYLLGSSPRYTKKIGRYRLIRMIADGYFEEVELSAARSWYEQLKKSSDAQDNDYAEYKLGWIDLNENKAGDAFVRWKKTLKSGNGRQQDLRRSLLRDIGRAWAETTPPTADELETMKHLSVSGVEEKDVVDGIASGVRRFQTIPDMNVFRKQLIQTQYYSLVLPKVIAQGTSLDSNACSVLEWFVDERTNQLAIQTIEPDVLGPKLSACYKQIKSENPETWKKHESLPKLLIVYSQVELRAYDRWPRAQAHTGFGRANEACIDYLRMSQEVVARDKKLAVPEVYGEMVAACGDLVQKGKISSQDRETLGREVLATLVSHSQFGVLGSDLKQPLYVIATYAMGTSEFRNQLFTELQTRPALFQKSALPALLAERLSEGEKVLRSQYLVENFAPRPIPTKGTDTEKKLNDVWIEATRTDVSARLAQNDFKGTRELLERLLPSTGADISPRARELWMLWVLALPEAKSELAQYPGYGDDIHAAQKFTSELISKKSLTEDEKAVSVALGMKFGMGQEIWKRWKTIKPKDSKNAKLVAEFYQRSFDQVRSGEIKQDSMKASSEGAVLAELANIQWNGLKSLSQVDRLLSRAEAELSVKGKSAHETIPALQDIRLLSALGVDTRKVQGTKLAFTSSLPKKIQVSLATIQGQIERSSKHTWADARLAKLSRQLIASTCDDFTASITKLNQSKLVAQLDEATRQNWQQQVDAIVAQVQGWKASLSREERS